MLQGEDFTLFAWSPSADLGISQRGWVPILAQSPACFQIIHISNLLPRPGESRSLQLDWSDIKFIPPSLLENRQRREKRSAYP